MTLLALQTLTTWYVLSRPVIEPAIRDAQIAAHLLGLDGQRRYLVLAQNPAELRPSGGYAGTVGVVAFERLRPRERTFLDVYQLDLKPGIPFVQPPDALANHLLGDQSWQLADAAWSPDFPTAAQNALRLYLLESRDANVDGVIALNTYSIDRLLELTGPIDVPEYGITVSAGEVTLTSLRFTRGISTPTSDRKAFLNVLANLLIDRLQALSPLAAPRSLDTLTQMVRERSLLIWFADPAAQALLAESPVSGAVRQDAGDYLYVVEANVAPPSKYNLVVDRSDTYAVQIDSAGDATCELSLRWQNDALLQGEPYESIRSYSTSTNGLYGAYVRVLSPATSQLVAAQGAGLDPVSQAEEMGSEAGRHVVGNYLLMAPGPSFLDYSWTTPGLATQQGSTWTYRLTIQKQPGLRPMPVSVTVSLPPGAIVDSISGDASADGSTITLFARPQRDLQFEVRYRLP